MLGAHAERRRTRRGTPRCERGGQEVHARRADEVADEHVLRPLEELRRAADLHGSSSRHHDDLVGEGERLDLVVRDVDQRELELMVDLLELAPQLPLQVRVDHRQRLVEQHRAHVLAHEASAERDLLLLVGAQARRALVELARQLQHLGDDADAGADALGRDAAVAQGERQVLGHRHGVVDHRELEHLRDVALLRRGVRHVGAVEAHRAVRGRDEARDDVQHGRLAAARGAEQRIGAAVLECHAQRQQRPVLVGLRVRLVRVRQVEVDSAHVLSPGATSRSPVGLNTYACAGSRYSVIGLASSKRCTPVSCATSSPTAVAACT